MKILLAHEAISPIGGGSQMAVFNWLKNLRKMGVAVKLLSNQPTTDDIFTGFASNALIINNSFNLSFIYPHLSISPFLSSKTTSEIIKFKPDIIHLHEPLLVYLALYKLARQLKIKTLASYHTNFSQASVNQFPLSLIYKKNGIFPRLLDKFQLYLLSQSDFLTTPSVYYQLSLLKKLKKKVFLLPYPIPDYFFQKKTKTPKKINKLITVSRLSGEKKIDLLIEMMSFLKNRFTLTIVGEGVDRKFLELKIKKAKLESVVKLVGWVANEKLPQLLKNHHLFISPSDYETFGITYIEALSVGLPCIVFDYPVSREIIPNSMALFVKTFDPRIWAKELQKIQENPAIFTRLKQNIYKNYEKLFPYHEQNSTRRLIEIYKEILRN